MTIENRLDRISRTLQIQRPTGPPMTPEDIADEERIARRWGDPDSEEYKERVHEHNRQAKEYNDARRKHDTTTNQQGN